VTGFVPTHAHGWNLHRTLKRLKSLSVSVGCEVPTELAVMLIQFSMPPLSAGFFLVLLFDPENGDVFLRNVEIYPIWLILLPSSAGFFYGMSFDSEN
jgi:hypothetical protein